MSNKPDGGAAYPRTLQYFPEDTNYDDETGMSLRQWYAGMALAGIASSPEIYNDLIKTAGKPGIGMACYMLADAMIAQDKANG